MNKKLRGKSLTLVKIVKEHGEGSTEYNAFVSRYPISLYKILKRTKKNK